MKAEKVGNIVGKILGQVISFVLLSTATTYVGLYCLEKLGAL